VIKPFAQSDSGKFLAGTGVRIHLARELEGDGDILKRGHCRNKVERLKDNSNVATAESRQRILIKVAEVSARNRNASGVRAFEARHHHEQRRFARA
jgi:hypothetical protein